MSNSGPCVPSDFEPCTIAWGPTPAYFSGLALGSYCFLSTEVFDDPFRFDVGRDPNKHLAFGFGVHYCLGAALARMETRALFAELLPRLESVELTGRPEWVATTFVGGLKRLPIRYAVAVE